MILLFLWNWFTPKTKHAGIKIVEILMPVLWLLQTNFTGEPGIRDTVTSLGDFWVWIFQWIKTDETLRWRDVVDPYMFIINVIKNIFSWRIYVPLQIKQSKKRSAVSTWNLKETASGCGTWETSIFPLQSRVINISNQLHNYALPLLLTKKPLHHRCRQNSQRSFFPIRKSDYLPREDIGIFNRQMDRDRSPTFNKRQSNFLTSPQ